MEEQVQEMVDQTVKQKKFYQKWWFWVIVVICSIFIISALSEEDSAEGNTEKSETKQESNTTTNAPEMSAEEYKNKCRSYTYDELARNPDSYKGKNVVLTGEVIQVIESTSSRDIELRVIIGNSYDDVIYVSYTLKDGEGRILEDDVLTIYGTFEGLISYETVLGAKVTIPYVNAQYIDQVYS